MISLLQRDKKILWHPFTQEKTAADIIVVKKAQGCYVYDDKDNPYLDLISSWWVNIHGHAHPEIARSIYDQAQQLEHVIFAGFTHAPAIELCEDLKEVLPEPLGRFFFSDNGSTAVEVALKMAYQYWYNQGKDRNIFLSFAGGYHGDTFGAMSVGAYSGFHTIFKDLLFKVLSIPYPAIWEEENDKDKNVKEQQALNILAEYLKEYKDKIAAIILEPLVQGASGMRMCHSKFVNTVIEQVHAAGILVIFDEVMTGFGRTGTMFALEQIDHVPDFLCLSKGLTGGFLPLALTVTSDKIYEAFLSEQWERAFAHGHSYTANPLACAAARMSLKLLRTPDCQQSMRLIHGAHVKAMTVLKAKCKNIEKIRMMGTISAFEISGASFSDKEQLNKTLKSQFLQNNLLLRPLGNTIYLLPPYCITTTELENAYEKIGDVLIKL